MMPATTAINSRGVVSCKPVKNWWYISGKVNGCFCKDKEGKCLDAFACNNVIHISPNIEPLFKDVLLFQVFFHAGFVTFFFLKKRK
jgi:hypothetical protein